MCIECSKAFNRKEYALHPERYAERYKNRTTEYCVYKFIDKDNNIVYVGKSKRLAARMIQHFRTDGHLSNDCYDNVASVFYCKLNTKIEMDIYEIYLIDKYRPQYNTVFVYESNEISNIVLPQLEWCDYNLKIAI